jgi:hypothetical protein
MRFTWLVVLALIVGLGGGREARAGGKVDWSDYLEPPGTRSSVTQRPAKATATPKASRAEAKKQTSRSKTKAKKTKRSARNPRRR